ncbi:MAG: protein-L-isoaspartate(D-aspartate) O-methyltransferase [Chloroflexi bacterium]|nr:protein-L-isoaspartate(D-aspartate) O-methyltransferase [Chloroflexota bacterium]
MVEEQLRQRGIGDTAVLQAMNTVPRELFVPKNYHLHAYQDGPLPLPHKQTISQPYVVAYMICLLRLEPGDVVLEVGAGSGYAAAVLSRLARVVYTIERHAELVAYARKRLAHLGYDNVHVIHGDGSQGYPEQAPFEAIVVAAGGPAVPDSLKQQLAIGGRLVMPVGADRRQQQLIRVTRVDTAVFQEERKGSVAFVPLIGSEGWGD